MNMNSTHTDWRPVFQPATEHASNALRRWTNGHIGLAIDDVDERPLDELGAVLQDQNELLTIVVMNVTGCMGGQLILTFSDHNARRLVELLLNRSVGTLDKWGELESSALRETGNIIASAYLTRISELVKVSLLPSAPCVVRDYGGSVLQQAVLPQAINEEQVLLCRTRVVKKGEPVCWDMFFVPSSELLAALREGAAVEMERSWGDKSPSESLVAIRETKKT